MMIELTEWAKELGKGWAKSSFVVCILLYVVGYLAIRFHLTAIGIGTDLSVFDERYLFAGARFLVYLVSSIPSIVLVALPLLLMTWVLHRLCPQSISIKTLMFFRQPKLLLVVGIVFVVGMIQFVMRQCFILVNLLLGEAMTVMPSWLIYLLIHHDLMPLFFSLLVGACVVSLSFVWALWHAPLPPGLWTAARLLLIGLVVVQILLLPINYGVLIMDMVMPRVATLGSTPLTQGDRAWLVWEGRDGFTFLIEGKNKSGKKLVTMARSDVKRMEILGYDYIMSTLYGK
jgi:hypothetical protein